MRISHLFPILAFLCIYTLCIAQDRKSKSKIKTEPEASVSNLKSIDAKSISDAVNVALNGISKEKLKYTPNSSFYFFSPYATLTLGRGFDPLNPEQVKQSPFTFTYDESEGQTSLEAHFNMNLAFSKSELFRLLDLDFSFNLKAKLLTNLNAQYSQLSKIHFDESTLCLVFTGENEYSRRSLKDITPKKEARELIDSRNFIAFRNLYGTKFAIMERRGAKIHLILVVKNVSSQLYSRLKTHLNVERGASSSLAGLKFTGDLETELWKRASTSDVSIEAISTGGVGMASYSKILSSLKDSLNTLENIKDGLAMTLKDFEYESSAPIGYYCLDYTSLNIFPSNYNETELKKIRVLSALADQFEMGSRYLFRSELIVKGEDPISDFLTSRQIQGIKTRDIPDLIVALDTITKQYNEFSNDSYLAPLEIPVLEKYNPQRFFNIEYETLSDEAGPFNILFEDFSYEIRSPLLTSVEILIKDFENRNIATIQRFDLGEFFDTKKDYAIIPKSFFSQKPFKDELSKLKTQEYATNKKYARIYLRAENQIGLASEVLIANIYVGYFKNSEGKKGAYFFAINSDKFSE